MFAPLNKDPWIPTSSEHKKAREGRNSRTQSSDSAQLLCIQSWALYRLRFIISAELCADWDLYGGLIAQLGNLGVTLNIAVWGISVLRLNISIFPTLSWNHMIAEERQESIISNLHPKKNMIPNDVLLKLLRVMNGHRVIQTLGGGGRGTLPLAILIPSVGSWLSISFLLTIRGHVG